MSFSIKRACVLRRCSVIFFSRVLPARAPTVSAARQSAARIQSFIKTVRRIMCSFFSPHSKNKLRTWKGFVYNLFFSIRIIFSRTRGKCDVCVTRPRLIHSIAIISKTTTFSC